MNNRIGLSDIEHVREQVRSALADATEEKTRVALTASLNLLETLVRSPSHERASKYAGSIEYTFADEQYEPFGREVDVRVYYAWYDYDPADEPSPVWGASIEDLEVLAVRHFDKHGNAVNLDEHCLDIAWHLLNQDHELVKEACTEDGYHSQAGKVPFTYSPLHSSAQVSAPAPPSFTARMAPSVPTRKAGKDRRQLG